MTVGIEQPKPRYTTRAVGDDTAELEEELARATTPIHRRRLQNRIAQRNHRKRVRLAQQQQREQEEEEQRQQQEQQEPKSPERPISDVEGEGQINGASEILDPMPSTPMRHPDAHTTSTRVHPGSPAGSRMSIDNSFAPSRTDFDFSMPVASAKPPTPISLDSGSNKSYRNSVSGSSFCMSCGAVNDVVDTNSFLDTSRRIQDWRPVSPIDFDDHVVDAPSFISLSQTQMNPDQHQPPPQQHQQRQQNHQHQTCHQHQHHHNHNNNHTHQSISAHASPKTTTITTAHIPSTRPTTAAPAPPPPAPQRNNNNTHIVQSKAGTAHKWTTALHIAAERGHEKTVRLLLGPQGGANVNEKDSRGSTALHVAAANGDEAMVRLLLDCNADVHAADEQGWSALHRAAERGDEGVLLLLLGARGGGGGGGEGGY
ncbi:Ankyrin repeat protein [Lasiodiplodia theobromae]|uniref:Ankyrin repeat protein n=1 Tax=Lasiodiplodia theobromae TaxID=45133 RepID=UPI0015C3DD66|nr:Ankyrin repeat protein [Lasiodiplodia theobromae]KAF4537162.1 Ankyrin repeat protein [Lasiodiplodia theobromae]